MNPSTSRTAATLAFALTAAALVPAPGAAAAPAKGPLTHEGIFLMKRVGSPAPSPDGTRVVVAVTEPAYDEKKESADLWIVPADGSAKPRRLTAAKGSESTPAWSPDGTRIAFAAKREDDEVGQIYVMDVAGGGEARRVTSSPLAARAPLWSPDGASILYQTSAYPGAAGTEANQKIAKERKDAKSKVRVYDRFPIRRWDKWLDDTQSRLMVVPAEGGDARDVLAETKLVAMPGYGAPTGEGSTEDLAPAWTPDGRSIVFVATTGRDAAARSSVDFHLFEVPAAGGEPRQLTSGHGSHTAPQFAPGGRSLCFRVSEDWGRIYALDRLACAPWPWTGAVTTLTRTLDRSVDDFAFAPDGKTVYFTAEDSGYVKLFSVPASGGEATAVLESRGAFGGIEVPPARGRPRSWPRGAPRSARPRSCGWTRCERRRRPSPASTRRARPRSTGSRCRSSGSRTPRAGASTASSRCPRASTRPASTRSSSTSTAGTRTCGATRSPIAGTTTCWPAPVTSCC
jgi:dipeptidyl aminopeptidase/acylaminoacyl peptidase